MSEKFDPGWYEYITDSSSLTKIAYVYESGRVYLPGASNAAEWYFASSRTRLVPAAEDDAPIRSDVLATADALVNGDRAKDYGDATESFTRLAQMWSAILGHKVSAAQVAMCLAALKLSRLTQTPGHRDSWVDLAGYAALGAEVAE